MAAGWTILIEIAITLAAAFLLGAVMERFRQSAVLGYLLAGALLGPGAFRVIRDMDAVQALAEIGVALLLFTIGLEFSWRRLRKMGSVALGGGTMQILLTGSVAAGIAFMLGTDWRPAVAIGAIVALSSTAIVVRVLQERAETDAQHGKTAIGILLVQDLALVPLVLLLTVLGDTSIGWSVKEVADVVAKAAAVAVIFIFLLLLVVPRALASRAMTRNRELPILLAVTTCIGGAWAAHEIGLSPTLGAFLAGMLLAESEFAEQIRADVAPIRILFVTLFFASIGMFTDVFWILDHGLLVLSVAIALVFGKALFAFVSVRAFGKSFLTSIATGVCLAQVGELSFMLLSIARNKNLMDPEVGQLLTSASVFTLFAAPFLVRAAPKLSRSIAKRLFPARKIAYDERSHRAGKLSGHMVLIGFGEAGETAARTMQGEGSEVLVVELDRRLAASARGQGFSTVVGDATGTTILEQLSLQHAQALVIAIPDVNTARMIISNARALDPDLPIVVRGRYHVHVEDLIATGANVVVDEENILGVRLGEAAFFVWRSKT